MSGARLTIACVACLDPARSVHTPTFLRAVRLALDHALPADVRVDLYDDGASAEGALGAAYRIVAAEPDIVVGHFASSAAQAAAPIYAQAHLPLILPAATRTDLTRHPGVYRVCDNDRDYVQRLCTALGGPIHAALSDGSAHGNSVVEQVRNATCFDLRQPPETVLISGLYAPTLALAGRTAARSLVLTDDADTPTLAADLAAAGVDFSRTSVQLGALRPRAQGQTAARIRAACPDPGTYAWETIAALQIAARWDDPRAAHDTVLGPLRFDIRGESRLDSFSLIDIAAPAQQQAA